MRDVTSYYDVLDVTGYYYLLGWVSSLQCARYPRMNGMSLVLRLACYAR